MRKILSIAVVLMLVMSGTVFAKGGSGGKSGTDTGCSQGFNHQNDGGLKGAPTAGTGDGAGWNDPDDEDTVHGAPNSGDGVADGSGF